MIAAPSLRAPERRIMVPPAMPNELEVPSGEWLSLSGDAYGTTWRVDVVYAGDKSKSWLSQVQRQIKGVLTVIDAQMSLWRADSDIVAFNAAPDGTRFVLAEPMLQVVNHALAIARFTNGAFDPTLCEAVERWGFGARAVAAGLPDIMDLQQERSDWRDVMCDGDVITARTGLTLDLCAIAKGYAVDAVMEMLQSEPDAQAALVEIGGELKGWGLRPDGMPWWISIEGAGTETLVALCGWAVATSGDYRRSFTHEGRDYCHAIDPQTLSPVQTGVISVSVFDPSCWSADALATAMMVMGRQQALAFAETHTIPCILNCRSTGGITDEMSPALQCWFDTDD